MSANFSNTDKATISSLSRSDIERTMAGLKPFLKRSMWIGTTNRYVNDVIARLRESEPNSATHKRNLAQYIAASTCLHANDGWSYLGRAFACLIAGDAHRALHLGYYAELRAAMSLLAGNGIGVFNNKHLQNHILTVFLSVNVKLFQPQTCIRHFINFAELNWIFYSVKLGP